VAERKTKQTVVALGHNHWRYDVVAVGASAGGLVALTEFLRPVAVDAPAILVVQHLDPMHKSHLAELIARKTAKQVKQAEHGELILPGFVYIGPPDEHLLVGPGKIQLVHSQLVHFSRPSIDLMFESVAGMYGSRSVGVILSGSNRDGAAGIRAIREAGGTTVAQDPASAEFRVMPQAAIDTGCVDFVAPISELGIVIMKLCRGERIA
jgi:two-component system chemotaxis response regulator CheB